MATFLSAINFDLCCIIFYAVAVLLARKGKAPWIVMGIGAFLEILGFAGAIMLKRMAVIEIVIAAVLFVILTALAIWLVRKRKAKAK